MWHVVREIAKGTTFYYKQLNFFLLCLLVVVGVVGTRYYMVSNAPQAATDIPRSLAPKAGGGSSDYLITISQSGKTTVNGKRVNGAISFVEGRGEFRLVLVREAQSYVTSLKAIVQLPAAVGAMQTLQPRIFGIHGVGSTNTEVVDQTTLRFSAYDVLEGGQVSLALTFPPGYLKLGPLDVIRSQASAQSLGFWVSLGFFFIPAVTVTFLGFLFYRRWKAMALVRNPQSYPLLPSPLPPALIGVLYHGKIGKREITATLFDLAYRGFLIIHHGPDDHIAFTKGANLYSTQANNLRPFEILLLHQIFGDGKITARGNEVTVALEGDLFSSKIAMSFVNVYDAALAEGYFVQNPNKYFLKYKSVAIVLFFLGFFGLVYGSFHLPEPALLLFVWVGVIIASLIAVALTPGLPRRTERGNQVLQQWMGFRNYLAYAQPLTKPAPNEFFAYLPYALVLECEHEWITRWKEQTIVLPKWFSAEETPYSADDYRRTLLSVIDHLSQRLVAARPPDIA